VFQFADQINRQINVLFYMTQSESSQKIADQMK